MSKTIAFQEMEKRTMSSKEKKRNKTKLLILEIQLPNMAVLQWAYLQRSVDVLYWIYSNIAAMDS